MLHFLNHHHKPPCCFYSPSALHCFVHVIYTLFLFLFLWACPILGPYIYTGHTLGQNWTALGPWAEAVQVLRGGLGNSTQLDGLSQLALLKEPQQIDCFIQLGISFSLSF